MYKFIFKREELEVMIYSVNLNSAIEKLGGIGLDKDDTFYLCKVEEVV